MRHALRRFPLVTALFAALSLATLAFATMAVIDLLDLDRAEPEPAQGWMTVGYVGRAWNVDPRRIEAQAGLPSPRETGGPWTLEEIAADRGVPVAEITSLVDETVAAILAERRADRRDGADGAGETPADPPPEADR